MKKSKVIVWGLGVTGLASVEFALRQGHEVLALDKQLPFDEKTLAFLTQLKRQFENLEWSDQQALTNPALVQETSFILLSPGIPREHELLSVFHQHQIPVINEIELASPLFSAPIIAITGSNGKTTTTLLTAHLLKGMGLKVFAGGNLGRPFVDYFNAQEQADVAVLELSSFQIESLFQFKAQSAALLNLSYTHAERYTTVLSYAKAKLRLASMSESFWLCTEDTLEAQELLPEWRATQELDHVHPLVFSQRELEDLYDLSDFTLLGKHNLGNLWCATRLILDVFPTMKSKLRSALKGFVPPEHRLEPVPSRQFNRLVVNDSKSTNWKATLTALCAFEGQESQVMLILGGKCRGGNDSILPRWESLKAQCSKIALYGESSKQHQQELESMGESDRVQAVAYGLADLLKLLKSQDTPRIWVFSPGFPSFDQFSNYEDRGRQFKNWIKDFSL